MSACQECGNDDPTEGHILCSDCLEASPDGCPAGCPACGTEARP